jgi:hypothetical protein
MQRQGSGDHASGELEKQMLPVSRQSGGSPSCKPPAITGFFSLHSPEKKLGDPNILLAQFQVLLNSFRRRHRSPIVPNVTLWAKEASMTVSCYLGNINKLDVCSNE